MDVVESRHPTVRRSCGTHHQRHASPGHGRHPNTEVGNAWAKHGIDFYGAPMRSMGLLEWIPVDRNNYVEKRKAKTKKPRSEITKKRISESLSGQKFGGRDSEVNPEDSMQLRTKVSQGDDFKYQTIIDWWRSLKD